MVSDRWWRDGVFYQIYVRSFADSNGDGVGDLRGITEHLDHLAWLGVDGIWLTPIHPSPDEDWGYDVADYYGVHPDLGTMEDVDRLIAEAGRRGIRVLLDLVPNHTSDRHPWFLDALTSRQAAHRDWYVWADPRPDGTPPNNWISVFGGPAWEPDAASGQFYLHNFLPEQPDLNWWNRDVRGEFDRILRFWLDRGVAGFRIDVAHGLVKDRALRDNLPATEDDPPRTRRLGQRHLYSMNRPEVHDIFRGWRRSCEGYDPPRVLVGETWIMDAHQLALYYGTTGDELHLCFNFAFVLAAFEAHALRAVVEATEAAFPSDVQPVLTASNHDVGRLATRWCGGDPHLVRCALLILLTLRGTPFLYYGDEIGMPNVDVPPANLRDPLGRRTWDEDGRDPCRTPMWWGPGPNAGFTSPQTTPWLPIGEPDGRSVAEQRGDPGSILSFCRDLIALRRRLPELRSGRYRPVAGGPPGLWAWRRGSGVMVAVNLGHDAGEVPVPSYGVLIGTDRQRDGETGTRACRIRPSEGLVLRVGATTSPLRAGGLPTSAIGGQLR